MAQSDPVDHNASSVGASSAPTPRASSGDDARPILSSVNEEQRGSLQGQHIGPYRILEPVGEGGMGQVFRAEQERPIRRIVAIKVIKLGMDTREVVARFEAERQALALMDHPCIAKVFDAGATDAGRPYFVMEWVRGEPITAYCDKRRFSLRQRLELFARVCEAVQHAHGKAIIHRDLKPSNILVTESDERPIPKIIDFGVAKAAGPRLTERSLYTEQGRLIGTPEYMSPEQAEMSFADVDTRSDIYSLGVILYELLSGSLPFESSALRKGALAEVQRMLRETDPPRPSLRLTNRAMPGEALEVLARQRGMQLDALTRELRHELEWIPLKAMRKDANERYRTATELGDDIRNYLGGRPLIAGPQSAAYKARKFLKRNRGPVAVAAALVLLLLAGVATTTWQAIRATRAQGLAQQRFNDVRDLAHTFIFDFDPTIIDQGVTPARKLLVSTALKYLQGLQRDADAAGSAGQDPTLLHELATAYLAISKIQSQLSRASAGGNDAAIQSCGTGVDLFVRLADADPGNFKTQLDLAAAYDTLGALFRSNGDIPSAAAQFRKRLGVMDKLGNKHPDDADIGAKRIDAQVMVGDVTWFMGDKQSGLRICRDAVSRAERLLADHPGDGAAGSELTNAYEYLADMYFNDGDYALALELNEKVLAGSRAAVASHPGNTGEVRNLVLAVQRVGVTQQHLGHLQQANQALQEGLAIARHRSEVDPANLDALFTYVAAIDEVGEADLAAGKHVDAAEIIRQGLAISRRMRAADPSDGLITLQLLTLADSLGEALLASGQDAEAIQSLGETIGLACDFADADPHNSERQTPAWKQFMLLGQAHQALARASAADGPSHWQSAADAYGKGLTRCRSLVSRGMLDKPAESDMAKLMTALRECHAAGATVDASLLDAEPATQQEHP
jgi:eukaryotic-like serine/threonine-protein kinase